MAEGKQASAYRRSTVIAVPKLYQSDFQKDPAGSLLQFGSLPQRARMPYFTNVAKIDEALTLPDVVCGPTATRLYTPKDGRPAALSLVADPGPRSLISGLSDTFRAPDDGSYWHVAFDMALHSKRHGDRAGFALGRIGRSWIERETSPDNPELSIDRIVRTFEVPLVAQIAAPIGEQIYLGSFVRLILQLKYERGFNITSFSSDRFQSADAAQQLMLAGLVTKGLRVDPHTGIVTGAPTSFSVDGRSTMPYQEVLESVNEGRVALPRYDVLRNELRRLEVPAAGYAPDHPPDGSKDCADAVAGVVGYLATFGHTELAPMDPVIDRQVLEHHYGVQFGSDLGVEDPADDPFDDGILDLGVE